MRISDTSTGDQFAGVAPPAATRSDSPLEAACIMQEHGLVDAPQTFGENPTGLLADEFHLLLGSRLWTTMHSRRTA